VRLLSNSPLDIERTLREAWDQPKQLASYTVAKLPSAPQWVAGMVYVSNEAGGAVVAFSDGTNWRRVTDRAIVS
jgi:hypothetical protein